MIPERASLNLLVEHLRKHINPDEDEINYLRNLLRLVQVKRKQFILRESEVCKYSTFILKGCLRGYTIDACGLEHVLSFAPPGWWIADMNSLITQKPGILNIEAMETTEVLQLSKVNQETLCREIPKFEHFFRIITENSLVSIQNRLTDNLSLSAEDRYRKFSDKYPLLVQNLPQKYIASYLGVTAEFFSKMKKKMNLKH